MTITVKREGDFYILTSVTQDTHWYRTPTDKVIEMKCIRGESGKWYCLEAFITGGYRGAMSHPSKPLNVDKNDIAIESLNKGLDLKNGESRIIPRQL